MPGLIGYITALADDISAVAAKVAAGSLDDIANQTAKSLSKTAGILVDDTATIPQYISNTTAKRELPVIWKITKKSLRNKALMIIVIFYGLTINIQVYVKEVLIMRLSYSVNLYQFDQMYGVVQFLLPNQAVSLLKKKFHN